mgnify:CR=1 FL=1
MYTNYSDNRYEKKKKEKQKGLYLKKVHAGATSKKRKYDGTKSLGHVPPSKSPK